MRCRATPNSSVGVFADRLILCGSPERARQVPDGITWSQLTEQAPILWEQSELTQTIIAALVSHARGYEPPWSPGAEIVVKHGA